MSRCDCLFFQFHEPQVDFIHVLNIFSENRLVSVFNDSGLIMMLLQKFDKLMQVSNLGVHNSEITHEADFRDL